MASGQGIVQLRRVTFAAPNALAIVAFGVYLGIGAYLAFVLSAFHGDAYSRVANAYYVLFSRDPHLAAIGFVWNPLPSLFELALLPASTVFPALAQQGFAAVIMSATFMALSVGTLNGLFVDVGLRRIVRLPLVLAFAVHPMILYYGAIGTSEAPMVFFSLLAVRYLIRYATAATATSLVGVGLALAGGYLTRYEAGAGALGAAAFIGIVAMTRSCGSIRNRFMHGAADVTVALTPFAIVFCGWALASWLIVGTPFQQFTSAYGNASQMAAGGQTSFETGLPLGPSLTLAGLRLGFLSIAGVAAPVLILWALTARRDIRVLAAAAVLAPVLGFSVLAYALHIIAPWVRYFILIVPMGVITLGLILAAHARAPDVRSSGSPVRSRALALTTTTLVLAVAIGSVPVAAKGMLSAVISPEEAKDFAPLLSPQAFAADRQGQQLRTYAGETAIASYLDSLDLPRGSVLLDVFQGFPIVLRSNNPKQFVITPDRDFNQILADPPTFGVQFLLAPPPDGLGTLDAINVQYRGLASRTDFAEVVQVFEPVGTSLRWTLYRLVGN